MNGDWLTLIGRVLLGLLFLVAGLGKIIGYDVTTQSMAAQGIPLTAIALPLTIAIEAGGGLLLMLGLRAKWAALALAAFTIAATLVYHRFWEFPPEAAPLQQIMFLKNLSITGGLLLLAAHGAGALSLERVFSRHRLRPQARP
jgi:putative oxidoreductase